MSEPRTVGEVIGGLKIRWTAETGDPLPQAEVDRMHASECVIWDGDHVSEPEAAKPFILVCRQCGDGENSKVLPFGSQEARGKWAAAHTRETGHKRWFVAVTTELDAFGERNREAFRFGILALGAVAPPLVRAIEEMAFAAAVTGTEPVLPAAEREKWIAVFTLLAELTEAATVTITLAD